MPGTVKVVGGDVCGECGECGECGGCRSGNDGNGLRRGPRPRDSELPTYVWDPLESDGEGG